MDVSAPLFWPPPPKSKALASPSGPFQNQTHLLRTTDIGAGEEVFTLVQRKRWLFFPKCFRDTGKGDTSYPRSWTTCSCLILRTFCILVNWERESPFLTILPSSILVGGTDQTKSLAFINISSFLLMGLDNLIFLESKSDICSAAIFLAVRTGGVENPHLKPGELLALSIFVLAPTWSMSHNASHWNSPGEVPWPTTEERIQIKRTKGVMANWVDWLKFQAVTVFKAKISAESSGYWHLKRFQNGTLS